MAPSDPVRIENMDNLVVTALAEAIAANYIQNTDYTLTVVLSVTNYAYMDDFQVVPL